MQPTSRHAEIHADDPLAVAIAALVRIELANKAAAGFPTLSRIPSSRIIKLLDYMAMLSEAELARLLDAKARLAALNFFPAPLIAAAPEQLRNAEPALLRQGDALQSPAFSHGLGYFGLRMSRMMLNDPENVAHIAQVRATLGFTPRDDLPDAFVGGVDVRHVETAKAPLLRKLLNQMLRTRLAGKPEKRPGGELVYETLWGMDTGWRYLTEENAARSIDLLDHLLLSLAGLLQRIAAQPMPN